MKEIVLSEASCVSVNIPEAECEYFRKTRIALAHKSSIVWGEHCTECAFPSCYASCEFYTPRHDLHCRRFAQGIENVILANAPDITGLTRIHFRQWGKLEGSGPPVLAPVSAAMCKEATATSIDRFLAAVPMPRRIGNSLIYRLNKKRKQRSLAIGTEGLLAQTSVFLIEGWLEQNSPVTMTISMLPWNKSLEGLFQKQFSFNKGYNREVIPTSAICQSLDLNKPFAIQIEVVGEPPAQPVIFGVVDFAKLTKDLANHIGTSGTSKTAKCVVWDLDETLWKGTLAEDGIQGIQLKQSVVDAIRLLDSKGILNSIASKNDEDLAMAALKHFGLDEYFLFPQITWGPKSDSVRRVAELIDIGVDTFVFIDDQPFERGEVGAAHPAVTIMTPDDIKDFSIHPLFQVPVTEESARRRLLYRNEETRQQAAKSAGTDYIGFLRSCSIELDVMPVTKESAERVYELTQRTNQLNVTGSRFTREEVQQFVENKSAHEGYALHCRDKFGDYGIIGFCVLNPIINCIEAFFMSCRVQRKRVEHAFFAWLGSRCLAAGAHELRIKYRKTAKNTASTKMFMDLGFLLITSAPDEGVFIRQLGDNWPDRDIVRVNAEITDRKN